MPTSPTLPVEERLKEDIAKQYFSHAAKRVASGRAEPGSFLVVKHDVQLNFMAHHDETDFVSWRYRLHRVGDAICQAYESYPAKEALQEINQIRQELDRTRELAAARSSLLLGRLQSLPLSSTPDWFEEQRPLLCKPQDGDLPANHAAVRVAEKLAQAITAQFGAGYPPEVDTGPAGRVMMEWHLDGRGLRWLIEAPDQPWPAVTVYELMRDRSKSAKPETRMLYDAESAVQSLEEFVKKV